MVKVPTFTESQVEELKPTPVNPKSAATFGGEIVDLSEGLGSIADHIKKIEGATAVRNSLTGFTQDAINIHNKVLQDPDSDNARQTAQDELQKAMDSRAEKIGDPEARNAFLSRASGILDRNFTSINSSLNSRQIKDFNKSMTVYGDGFVSDYANLSRPDQMKASIGDFSREVDLQGKLSGQPQAVLNAYKKQYIYKAQYAQASHDIELNPQMALKQLELGDKGMHSDLRTGDRDKLIENAKSKIEQDKKKSDELLKASQKKNFDSAAMKKSIGALTNDQIEELYYTKQINPEQYNSLIKNGLSPKKIASTTNKDSYLGAINMLTNPKIPIEKKQIALIDLNTEGKLSTIDMQHLYNLHIVPNKEQNISLSQTPGGKKDLQLLDKAEKEDEQLRERSKAWFGVQGLLEGHSDDPHHVSDLMKELHTQLSQEKNVTPEMIHTAAQGIVSKDVRNQLVKSGINVDGITENGIVLTNGLLVFKKKDGSLAYRTATPEEIQRAQGGQ